MATMRPRLVRASLLHRLGAAIVATALAVIVGVSPAAVRTALAADPLRIEADATYVLDPGDGRVHVAIDFELTNLKPNSATTIFYYSSYLTAIHPDAVGLRVTDASGALSITTNERRFFTRLEVQPPELPVLQRVDAVHRPVRPAGRCAPLGVVGPREPGIRDVRGVGMG